MTRLFPLFALVLVVGCNKPSDEMCRKAIRNVRSLMGTDSPTNQADIEGDVRRCKGGSTKKTVECAAKATTIEELRACGFPKSSGPAAAAGSNALTGSAAPPAGSGDTLPGSAGAPAMTGSASPSAAGSAAAGSDSASAAGSAGSAAAGSAAAGSDTGSAAGSAK